MSNFIWAEKYRPTSLENYIGAESLKNKIQKMINEKDIPHLLFHGKQGTGKTTLAKIISKSIDADTLYINASDENNVETVRNKIRGFVSALSFSDLKVVILDEAEFISIQGQAALRNLMETFSTTSRFILTCNYVERLIDPVISRCQQFQIYPPSKKEVAKHLSNILENESILFTLQDLKLLIDAYYPDIRKIINEAQSSSFSGSFVVDQENIIESDFRLKIIELLKNSTKYKNTFNEIRQFIANNSVKDFADIYSLLYEKVDEYSTTDKISSNILAIADGQFRDSVVVDKEINFMATIINILK